MGAQPENKVDRKKETAMPYSFNAASYNSSGSTAMDHALIPSFKKDGSQSSFIVVFVKDDKAQAFSLVPSRYILHREMLDRKRLW